MADGQAFALLLGALPQQPQEWWQRARPGSLASPKVRPARLAAPRLRTRPSSLEACFRRLRSQLGPAKATTATAHNLATMLSHLLKEYPP
jgi:hypothetical protein